jgi:hypothetical protein
MLEQQTYPYEAINTERRIFNEELLPCLAIKIPKTRHMFK